MAARRKNAPDRSESEGSRRRSGVRASARGQREDRRRSARFEVDLEVRFAVRGDEPSVARCANLSRGGMFVHGLDDPAGTELRLWLQLPDGSELFMAGTVRWLTDHGAGVEQTLLGADDTHRLAGLLASLPDS